MKLLPRTRRFPCHEAHAIRWPSDAVEGRRSCPVCKARWSVSIARASTELEASVGCAVYRIQWEPA